MLRFFRFLFGAQLSLMALAELRAADSAAGATSAITPAPPLPPELQAELDALARATWHPSAAARASLGWRDNVLLSPFSPIERSFARGEIEAILLRPMRDRWQFLSFLNGDVLRYFAPPPESRGEQQWSLHTEARWQPINRARLALKGAGYLRDMVVDLSETEASRVVAPTRVRGAYVIGVPRVTFGRFQFEPSVQLKRVDYRDFAGDYDEVRSGGRLEWRYGGALAVSAAWFEARRSYDERMEYNAGGRPLPGTQLRFRQRESELKVRTSWNRAGEWSLAGSVGRLENRDQAFGYFDYDQKRARFEVEWEAARWRVHLDAETKRMDFLVQTVGAGIAPPPRISDDHDITLRAERELDGQWTLFVEHRWERSRSNEIEFCYRANTVLAGLQRSF